MEYRRLGKSGLKISALSLGSWLTFGKQITDEVAEDLMRLAYDNGINFFDNAEVYAQGKSEIVMGNILKKMGWDRSTYLVSSKVFWGGDKPIQKGLSRKHVTEACHAALKRLQLDYLDLYFCHRPDRNTPIEETVWAMHSLVMQGKVLYWGTSEWSAQEIMAAHLAAERYSLIGPVMEQPQYNMFHRYRVEIEYQRIYQDIGLGTTVWSPLASGILTGKYNKGLPQEPARLNIQGLEWLRERTFSEERINKVQHLESIARQLQCSMAQLAIAWCLKNPNVSTVILGASKVAQLEENLKALDVYTRMDDNIMQQIEEVLQNKPVVDFF